MSPGGFWCVLPYVIWPPSLNIHVGQSTGPERGHLVPCHIAEVCLFAQSKRSLLWLSIWLSWILSKKNTRALFSLSLSNPPQMPRGEKTDLLCVGFAPFCSTPFRKANLKAQFIWLWGPNTDGRHQTWFISPPHGVAKELTETRGGTGDSGGETHS